MSGPPWGLTDTGFNAKPLTNILEGFEARQRANVHPRINVRTGPLAIQNGIMADEYADLWQLGLAISSIIDPDAATGPSLSSMSLMTGTKRRDATKSVARLVVVNVDPGNYVAGALKLSVEGSPSSVFENMDPVVNSGGAAADRAVDFQAVTSGPVPAVSGSLNVIAENVTGFNSGTNPTDAIVGLEIETDPDLRERRDDELAASGSTTEDAIRADILQNLGLANGGDVVSCTVLGNDKDTVSPEGLPPHSIEVIVRQLVGGADNDQKVANQIQASKAAGDNTYAGGIGVMKTVTDTQGKPHLIFFSRAEEVELVVVITVLKNPRTYAGDTAVKAAIATWAQANLTEGKDVVLKRVGAAALAVQGVEDYDGLDIGDNIETVSGDNYVISLRQYATIDTANVTVDSSQDFVDED